MPPTVDNRLTAAVNGSDRGRVAANGKRAAVPTRLPSRGGRWPAGPPCVSCCSESAVLASSSSGWSVACVQRGFDPLEASVDSLLGVLQLLRSRHGVRAAVLLLSA